MRNNKKPNGRNNRSRKYRSGGNDSQSLARQKKQALTQKEKYLNMARDALSNGDRVEAEYYFQHVEHYSRVVGEIIAKEPAPKEKAADDASDDAGDDTAADNDNGAEAKGNEKEIPLPASVLPEADDVQEAQAQA